MGMGAPRAVALLAMAAAAATAELPICTGADEIDCAGLTCDAYSQVTCAMIESIKNCRCSGCVCDGSANATNATAADDRDTAPAAGACVDDGAWVRDGDTEEPKSCAWLAEDPSPRCDPASGYFSDEGVPAAEGCCDTCDGSRAARGLTRTGAAPPDRPSSRSPRAIGTARARTRIVRGDESRRRRGCDVDIA